MRRLAFIASNKWWKFLKLLLSTRTLLDRIGINWIVASIINPVSPKPPIVAQKIELS